MVEFADEASTSTVCDYTSRLARCKVLSTRFSSTFLNSFSRRLREFSTLARTSSFTFQYDLHPAGDGPDSMLQFLSCGCGRL